MTSQQSVAPSSPGPRSPTKRKARDWEHLVLNQTEEKKRIDDRKENKVNEEEEKKEKVVKVEPSFLDVAPPTETVSVQEEKKVVKKKKKKRKQKKRIKVEVDGILPWSAKVSSALPPPLLPPCPSPT